MYVYIRKTIELCYALRHSEIALNHQIERYVNHFRLNALTTKQIVYLRETDDPFSVEQKFETNKSRLTIQVIQSDSSRCVRFDGYTVFLIRDNPQYSSVV